ncbi:hypothetical protein AAG906_000484 [Vitis piasezkii]
MRGSACVEVMTTLHGSTRLPPYTWVHLRAFRASIAAVLDPIFPLFSLQLRDRTFVPRLDIPLWIRAEEEYFQDQDFYSQSGYSFVDQSRGQISSGFRYTRYGSAGRHGRSVHNRWSQGRPPAIRDETSDDSHPPPPPHPLLDCIVHHHMYYMGTRDRSTKSHPCPCRR